jgi:GNAT superfamily N-acetyltransferase
LKQLWPERKLDKSKLRRVYSATLKDPDYGFLAARHSGKIIGLVTFMFVKSLWQPEVLCVVNELVVDSSLRGLGIGTGLIDEVTKIARKRKCVRIELDSAFFRKDAHRFYEAKGFEKRAFLFSKNLEFKYARERKLLKSVI